MAQYISKAAVVAEIERRMKVLYKDRDFNYLQIKELEALLSFLDTLEVKDVQDEPVSEDLEKAAVEAFKQIVDSGNNNFLEIFKAGAEWKEKEMQSTIELVEDHAILAGMNKMEQQIMEKNFVTDAFVDVFQNHISLVTNELPRGLKQSDKFKMILIKQE